MKQRTVRYFAALIGGASMSVLTLVSSAADMPTSPRHPMYFAMRSTVPTPKASAPSVAYVAAANPRHPSFSARSNAPANAPAIVFEGAAYEANRNPLHPSYRR